MRAPALGGSFTGLEPMGLIWALEPEKPLFRLVKRDVQTPFVVELEVLEGHQPEGGRLLGQAVHERDFLAPGVQRVPVRAGRVRATLFLPPGERNPIPVSFRCFSNLLRFHLEEGGSSQSSGGQRGLKVSRRQEWNVSLAGEMALLLQN